MAFSSRVRVSRLHFPVFCRRSLDRYPRAIPEQTLGDETRVGVERMYSWNFCWNAHIDSDVVVLHPALSGLREATAILSTLPTSRRPDERAHQRQARHSGEGRTAVFRTEPPPRPSRRKWTTTQESRGCGQHESPRVARSSQLFVWRIVPLKNHDVRHAIYNRNRWRYSSLDSTIDHGLPRIGFPAAWDFSCWPQRLSW